MVLFSDSFVTPANVWEGNQGKKPTKPAIVPHVLNPFFFLCPVPHRARCRESLEDFGREEAPKLFPADVRQALPASVGGNSMFLTWQQHGLNSRHEPSKGVLTC